MRVGGVLQVIATARGSLADFEGWAKVAKDIELLAQETTQQNGETLYVHYVRRTK
jgi:TusA-related sulfurtransferase